MKTHRHTQKNIRSNKKKSASKTPAARFLPGLLFGVLLTERPQGLLIYAPGAAPYVSPYLFPVAAAGRRRVSAPHATRGNNTLVTFLPL